MNTNLDRIPTLLNRLYEIVEELEALYPGRKFTPDGHLVGSLGEVIAAHNYDLVLLDSSAKTHDAHKDGKLIQIKATQGKSVAFYGKPDYLLVLKLRKDGTTEEIFNGPGALAWTNAGKQQKNGQRSIALSKLHALMETVPVDKRIPRK
jgi:hypothetical protein